MKRMEKTEIPKEWDLGTDPRYRRQNMERAMRGKIERGLVELITNSDDSYRDLEDKGNQTSGKIRIEIERRKKGQPTIVIVRDRAGGMNRKEMFEKLGTLGRRTSGFEEGKARRGLHGRGAKDVAAFGTVYFESIKDGEYNCLKIPPSLMCQFTEPYPIKVNDKIRQKLGIPRGNGTVVTIEVQPRFKVPQHETLLKDFSRYYSLRDLFSNPNREIVIVNLNNKREDRLIYKYPDGEIVFDSEFTIPNYPDAKAHLVIYKHKTSFEQEPLPYREGILIKSAASIHDCTYFGLESEPLAWMFSGQVQCDYIDTLIREYDDREEKNPDSPGHPTNNPIRLLDPFRDGLIDDHPFVQALYNKCREILQEFIEELKENEENAKRAVTNESLEKKLDVLSKEVSKLFEEKLIELEEEVTPDQIDDGIINERPLGLHIIPPDEQPIIVNQPKTFSIIIKHFDKLDKSLPIEVLSSDPDSIKVRTSPVFLKKISDDEKVGRTTFTVVGNEVGDEAFIEAHYGRYNNLVLVKVIDTLPPDFLPEGLSFDKPSYNLIINKEKTITLWLKTNSEVESYFVAEITSDHPDIVVKGGGKCQLRETGIPGIFRGQLRITGRQLQAKGILTARIKDFEPAKTSILVLEREKPKGEIKLKFKPVEEDFGPVRYKWDKENPYLLLIGAKHYSIRRYLGEPNEQGYPGLNSSLYYAVLAEVIAEALAFTILEKQFKKEGQDGMLDYASTDAYYHKNFSEFLKISHKILIEEPKIG